MRKLYIAFLTVCLCAFPVQAGDLDGIANALENMADTARSLDNANESLQDAFGSQQRSRPKDYYHDHYMPHEGYGHARTWGQRQIDSWRYEHDRARAARKADKEWRKEYKREMRRLQKRRHHQKDD